MPSTKSHFQPALAFVLAGATLSPPAAIRAQAVAGALEINDTCAVQTGCFAGDAPGYPVTISQRGSHRLTGNLVQPSATTTVLRVLVNDASIDLGGFAIAGPFTCPGNPASCAAAGIGYAIDANGVSGVWIANGAVRGTARGLLLGDHCRVDDLRIVETTNTAIVAGTGCSITRVVVARNGNNGVQLDQGTISDSAAHDNEGDGFSFGSNGTISSSSARRNGGGGITGNAGTSVTSCVASDNAGNGISLNAGSSVTASASYSNVGLGITTAAGGVVRFSSSYGNAGAGMNLGAGSQAVGNTIRANAGLGLLLGEGGAYRENSITGNNGGLETQVGPAAIGNTIFNLGSNICGTDTTCP